MIRHMTCEREHSYSFFYTKNCTHVLVSFAKKEAKSNID